MQVLGTQPTDHLPVVRFIGLRGVAAVGNDSVLSDNVMHHDLLSGGHILPARLRITHASRRGTVSTSRRPDDSRAVGKGVRGQAVVPTGAATLR